MRAHIGILNFRAHKERIVDCDNSVARQHSRLFSRSSGYHFHHIDWIVVNQKRNTYSAKHALNILIGFTKAFSIEIGGMWVEIAEQFGYCHLHKVADSHSVDVVVGNKIQNHIEFSVVVGQELMTRESGAHKHAKHHRYGYNKR